jgi:hypothetical protein
MWKISASKLALHLQSKIFSRQIFLLNFGKEIFVGKNYFAIRI